MAVGFSNTNKPLNPRGQDASPKGYNRAALYSGKALDFDGVNDYVQCDNLDTLYSSDFTISYFFKWESTGDNWGVTQGQNGTNQSIITGKQNSGVIRFAFWGNDLDAPVSLTPAQNEWAFLSFTYNRTTKERKIYINGILAAEDVSAANPNPTASTFQIGAFTAIGGYYNNQVSNVKVFDVALTAEQVADLYNNPEKVVPTGVDNTALKLWLPMMEGAGTTAYDGSGNGNHGTISGATYVNGIGAPVAQSAVIDWNKSSNYIDKSEEFESSYWTENRLVTITDDSFTAPDGSATATEIIENTANDSHFLAQTLSVTAGDYFISVYAKKRDYDFIQLSTGGDTSRYANFNISTGATGNANGITDLIIENAGNGWYRIGGKITTSATSFNYFVTLIQSDVASRFQTYTGTDKGQYIWGAQATKSATLQPYLRNIGTSAITSEVLLPQGLTTGRDITGVNLFENVRKQGALNLDGNSWGKVHPNNSFSFGTGAFSMEAWVKLEYVNTGSYANEIITLNDSDDFSIKTISTGMSFAVGSGVSLSHTITLDNSWAHIVGVRNADGSMKLYINAVEEESNAAGSSTASVPIDNPVRLGTDSNEASRTYKDQIAQPRIYNRALTASEVLQNYNSGKNTYK
jgi:hypothetical protein